MAGWLAFGGAPSENLTQPPASQPAATPASRILLVVVVVASPNMGVWIPLLANNPWITKLSKKGVWITKGVTS